MAPNNPVRLVAANQNDAYIKPENVPLEATETAFDGGGGDGPVEPTISMKEYVDARDDAVESRLSSKLDKLPTKATVWGAAGTVLGIALAVFAIAGDRFNGGMSISPTIAAFQAKQTLVDAAQDTRLDARLKAEDAKVQLMNDKLDVIIRQTAANNASR